jgi:hypothetical protein
VDALLELSASLITLSRWRGEPAPQENHSHRQHEADHGPASSRRDVDDERCLAAHQCRGTSATASRRGHGQDAEKDRPVLGEFRDIDSATLAG